MEQSPWRLIHPCLLLHPSEITMASAAISDLTDNRIVIAGTSGALEDDANFTFDGTTLTVGQTTIAQATGNTTVGGTLDVTGVTNFNDTTAATNTTSVPPSLMAVWVLLVLSWWRYFRYCWRGYTCFNTSGR